QGRAARCPFPGYRYCARASSRNFPPGALPNRPSCRRFRGPCPRAGPFVTETTHPLAQLPGPVPRARFEVGSEGGGGNNRKGARMMNEEHYGAPGVDDDDDDDQGPVRTAELSPTAQLAAERVQEVLDPNRRPTRDPEQPLTVRDLFEAGVHFGHQTKRWNPKMRPYIYGSRSGIHIIDLDQTAKLFKKAFDFVMNTVARGGTVLFVGTKRQAATIVQEEATRAGMYYVTNRWLGGTLTNFRTMKGGLDRLRA